MPVMPLLYRGKPLPSSGIRDALYGVMAFPDDFLSLASYVALSGVPRSKLTEPIISKVENRGKGGSIAGAVFLYLLGLKMQRPKDASVGKAVHIITKYLKNSGQRHAPKHIDRVHTCWATYQSSAHLWAAYLLARQKYRGLKSASDNALRSDANGSNELSDPSEDFHISEILQIGEALFSKATELGLVFEKDSWRLPKGYPREELKIDIFALPDCVAEFLKEYKAPVRSHSKSNDEFSSY
jgi:hypothetical protein